MKYAIFALIFSLGLMTGCGTVPVKIYNDYKSKSPQPKKVAVMINYENLNRIDDIDSDILDDLPKREGQPADSVYFNFLIKTIDKEMRARFPIGGWDLKSYPQDSDYWESISVTYEKGNPPVQHVVPKSPEKFRELTDAEIIVIINKISLKRRVQITFTGMGASTSEFLSCVYEYSVWDNVEGKLVTTATPTFENSIFMVMTTGTWESNIRDFLSFVFKNPPMGVKPQGRT